jgi:TonB family protein
MRKNFLFAVILVLFVSVFAVAGDDVKIQSSGKPKIVQMVKPEYPADAKAAKITGAVVLKIEIQPDGSVKVLSMKGPDQLQAVASAAVSQWKYEPVLLNGKPVAAKAEVTVNFALDKDAKQP